MVGWGSRYSDWLRARRSGIESRWGEIFCTYPDLPWGPLCLPYNVYQVFPVVKSGRGVTLAPHSFLVLWSRKIRAIPLLPLWAVRSVQSLSSCTRVHFTVYLQFIHLHSYEDNVYLCAFNSHRYYRFLSTEYLIRHLSNTRVFSCIKFFLKATTFTPSRKINGRHRHI